MSLRKGIHRAMGAYQKGASAGAGGGGIRHLTLDNPQGWLTGDDAAMSAARAMKISTVNRCVEVLSNSMAVLPIYIMDEKSKERLSGHWLGPVLWSRANEAMSSFDYGRLMMCHELLQGNAYAWIHRSARTGHAQELIPLLPWCVQPKLDSGGKLWYLYTNPETGEVTRLPPADVLHYKAYSEDGLTGISVLRRAALTLDTSWAAQQYENSMWRNGGRPSGVLTADTDIGGSVEIPMPDGTVRMVSKKERVREEWEKVHNGPGKSFRIAVLDNGLKYQAVSMNNTDAQFVESGEVRVSDICRFFGVPLHLAYAGKQSYQSNEQNGIEYVNYTLLPYETQWGQEDTFKLLPISEREKSLRIKRELKVFLRGDTQSQAAWYTAQRNNGAYSANDIRALDDMPKIPGGDGYYASWNYGPLDRWEELSVLRAMTRRERLEALEDGGTT